MPRAPIATAGWMMDGGRIRVHREQMPDIQSPMRMSRRWRHRLSSYVVALTTIASALTLAIGCGGKSATNTPSSARSEVAIRVGARTVAVSTVNHWVQVEGVISRVVYPRNPIPAGFVPDPPRFQACASYVQRYEPDTRGVAASIPELKRECRQRYERLRTHVLEILATYQWLIGEGTRLGLVPSEAELKAELHLVQRQVFHDRAAFRRYLKYSGQSLRDELSVLRADMISTRLQRAILTKYGRAGAAKFFKRFPARWAAKTSCGRAYVTPDCREYRGPLAPEATT
jgi:hypothetical protein